MNKNTLSLSVLALSLVFSFGIISHADAAALVSYNFEDGVIPKINNGNWVQSFHVNPAIFAETDGNHFLKMTATSQDCGPNFATTCPNVRAQIEVYALDYNANPSMTFNFSMRIPSVNSAGDHTLMQLFQFGGGHGGPLLFLEASKNNNNTLIVDNLLTGEMLNLGPIQYDKWLNFSIYTFLTTDPGLGRIDVWMNGQPIGSLAGATLYVPPNNMLTMDIGAYGSMAGEVDFDNIVISSGSTTPPPPASSLCPNLLNSTLSVPAGFGASFNWFTNAKELLMNVICSPSTGSGQVGTVNVGNGSNTQYIYKTGYMWQNGAWSLFNYSGSSMDSGGNWFIGSANHSLGTLDLTQKQSVLSYICEWSGTQWHCGCHDSSCSTGFWNLQQFKQ